MKLTKRRLNALRNNMGAIDLASIMVGVVVLGVVASTVSATVFSVVPWAQNEATRGDLRAVQTAQTVHYVLNGEYGSLTDLTLGTSGVSGGRASGVLGTAVSAPTEPLLQAPNREVTIVTDGDDYIASAVSETGVVYFASSRSGAVSDQMPVVPGLELPGPSEGGAVNLVTDGGFDIGVGSWAAFSDINPELKTGPTGGFLSMAGGGRAFHSQHIAVAEGKTVTFSADTMYQGATPNIVTLFIYSPEGASMGSWKYTQSAAAGAWGKVGSTFTMPEGAGLVGILLATGDSESPAGFDNITLSVAE